MKILGNEYLLRGDKGFGERCGRILNSEDENWANKRLKHPHRTTRLEVSRWCLCSLPYRCSQNRGVGGRMCLAGEAFIPANTSSSRLRFVASGAYKQACSSIGNPPM